MTMTLLYARDVACHFLVEIETAEEWFRTGVIKEADNADVLSGHWVTTPDHLLRAIGVDPVNLDEAARARWMEEPVTADELAWLLSSGSKRLTAATARLRMRKAASNQGKPGFHSFKLPGSKMLYAHRCDVERKLNRLTSRARFLEFFPDKRKPRK